MTATFRARLRFRLQKRLNLEATEYRFHVAQREVVMTSPTPGCLIRDSEWLVMNTRGFASEEEAREFGCRLRLAVELSSVSTRLGVDAGRDVATSGLGPQIKEQLARETGTIMRDNVHGLDVFIDDPNVRIFQISGTATIHANPERFLPMVAELHSVAASASPKTQDLMLLLNYALMRPEPVAQIVFAFSAVEMLGQSEVWTAEQDRLLSELAATAESSSTADPSQRREVAEAIRRSMHRLTLRQGVLRLLDGLDLAHLKKDWDRLYRERSTLVHGLAPRPGADYGDLATRAVNLCGRILLTAIAAETPLANRYVELLYELPKR